MARGFLVGEREGGVEVDVGEGGGERERKGAEAGGAEAEEGAAGRAAFLAGGLAFGLGLGLGGGEEGGEDDEAFDPSSRSDSSSSAAEEKDVPSPDESTSSFARFLLVVVETGSIGSARASCLIESLAAVEAFRLGRGGMAMKGRGKRWAEGGGGSVELDEKRREV